MDWSTPLLQELACLVEPGALQNRLETLPLAATLKNVEIGLLLGGRSAHATLPNQSAMGRTTPLGCVTKLLTAALVHRAVADGKLSLEGEVTHLLRAEDIDSLPTGITVRQLLNHTHGIDDSSVRQISHRADGFIDVSALVRALCATPRLAAPGRFYSYSNIGAWLNAGALESIYSLKYQDILTSMLLDQLGVRLRQVDEAAALPRSANICAATGGALLLSVMDLLKFLERQLLGTVAPFEKDSSKNNFVIQDLPGWHSIERGVCLGWKCYGEGWFGHNSEVPNAALLVRVNPQAGIGIVVASGNQSPTSIASALFRRYLPGLVRLEMPPLLKEPIPGPTVQQIAGAYANSAQTIVISRDDRSVVLDARSTINPTQRITTLLQPAQNGCFFLQPPAIDLFPFVQFVAPATTGFEYMWTGSRMLRRVDT